MDFLKLFIEVAKVAKPTHTDLNITDPDEPLKSVLDSLDNLMIGIFLCDIYGISEEVGKTCQATTVNEYLNFVNINKTKEPESLEKAVESIK